MDLNCAVTSDLLPLYLEGLCCEETEALVEAHLAECQSCREKRRRMTAEPVPESAGAEIEQTEGEKPLKAKKVLKRIRRRFMSLLLCALLIVPVTLLSVNQVKGTGMSFTAIPYVFKAQAFLSAVKEGDYEKAFSLVDAEREYNSYAIPLYGDFSEHPLARYQETELGGESYYVTDEIYQNIYADYQRDGDEVSFWMNLLLFHESMHDRFLVIPERVMPEIGQYMENDAELNQTLKDFLSDFSLIEGETGSYYMDSGISEEALTGTDPSFSVLPSFYYNQAVKRAREEISEMNELSTGYAALGPEKFKELSYAAFAENLESLARKDTVITGWRLTDIYVTGEKYHIAYAVSLMVKGQPENNVSLEFIIGKNGIMYCLQQGEDAGLSHIRLIRYYAPEQEG